MPQVRGQYVTGVWAPIALAIALGLRWANAAPAMALDHWQRAQLGLAFPATSVLLMAAALLLPALALRAAFARRDAPAEEVHADALQRATARYYALLALAAAAILGAIVCLGLSWTTPRGDGPAAMIDLAKNGAFAEGAALVTGARPAGGELRHADGLFGNGHVTRYLPIAAQQGAPSDAASLIVQLPDDGLIFDPSILPTQFRGVMVRDALPGPVADTLRERGALTAGRYWVLFTQPDELAQPDRQVAAQLLMAGICLLAFAGAQWWALRRLIRTTPAVSESSTVAG